MSEQLTDGRILAHDLSGTDLEAVRNSLENPKLFSTTDRKTQRPSPPCPDVCAASPPSPIADRARRPGMPEPGVQRTNQFPEAVLSLECPGATR